MNHINISAYNKPLPDIEPGTQPFWDALREHRLLYQFCSVCRHRFAPYQVMCPSCWSGELEDRQSSGYGKVYTFSVVHRAPMPAFRPDVPYAVAIVQLEEGVYFTSNIIDCPVEDVRIGMPVQVEYVPATAEITLAKFRPVGLAAANERSID